MHRISVIGMMGIVALIALGVTALTNASKEWSAILFFLNLVFLGIAVLCTIHFAGKKRAWWFGFALFDGAYLLLPALPWVESHLEMRSHATILIEHIYSIFARQPAVIATELKGLTRRREHLAKILKGTTARKNGHANQTTSIFEQELLKLDRQIYELRGIDPDGPLAVYPLPAPSPPSGFWGSLFPPTPSYDEFFEVGNWFLAIMAGLAGGQISYTIRARAERTTNSPPSGIQGA
jgi:hypothetical protein